MAPAIGVGIVALANVALIVTAVHVRVRKVEDSPYAASAHEDERAIERASFATRGWRIETAVDGSGVLLTLHLGQGAPPVSGLVRLYRPDDPAADRIEPWSDPKQPLRVALPRPGAWSLRIEFLDAAGAVSSGEARLNRP
jgi:nitrogen fixation protein FixH